MSSEWVSVLSLVKGVTSRPRQCRVPKLSQTWTDKLYNERTKLSNTFSPFELVFVQKKKKKKSFRSFWDFCFVAANVQRRKKKKVIRCGWKQAQPTFSRLVLVLHRLGVLSAIPPEGGPGMSDVSPLSGISGLSFGSILLSTLLFFCLVLLPFLSNLFLPAGPFSWIFP